jgi:hypothetical protein
MSYTETFDGVTAPALPGGHWTFGSGLATTASPPDSIVPISSPNVLLASALGDNNHRYCTYGVTDANSGDVTVSVYLNADGTSREAVGLLARGSSNTLASSGTNQYWALFDFFNLEVDLYVQTSGGGQVSLGSTDVSGISFFPGWYLFTYQLSGTTHTLTLQQISSGYYVNNSGGLQTQPTSVLSKVDGTVSGAGTTGFTIQSRTGSTVIDNWSFFDGTATTTLYAADAGSGQDSANLASWGSDSAIGSSAPLAVGQSGDSASVLEGFLTFLMGSEAAVGLSAALPGAWSGDSSSGAEAWLATILTEVDVTATDIGFGDDSGFLLVAWGADSGTAADISLESYILWAVDSGYGDDSGALISALTAVAYTALDSATSQESAPAPTAWATDSAFGDDSGVLGVLLGGESGVGADEAAYQTGTLIVTDSGSGSEATWWSTVLIAVDAGYGGETYGFNLVSVGYYVYSNTGIGDPINYITPIATILGFENTTWVSAGLAYPGTWKFGVRAFSPCGTEQNVDCVVTIVLDASGNDVTNVPNPPIGLRAFSIAAQ